jgi:hypothetical protein
VVLSPPAAAADPPLPPSWRAFRRVFEGLGLALDAADCYGFGGGLGFRYVGGPAPLLLGVGGLDPMDDLVVSVGAWRNGWADHRGSDDQRPALEALREHLARDGTPVVVRWRAGPDDEPELDPDEPQGPPWGFVTVHEMNDERVVYRRGGEPEGRELSVAALAERLAAGARCWATIIGNRRWTPLAPRLHSCLRRMAHRLSAGFRGPHGGLAALDRFGDDFGGPGAPAAGLAATLRASAQLGGGLGRGLFADFVERYAARLPPSAASLAGHYRDLDGRWRAFERAAAGGEGFGALLPALRAREAEGLERLVALTDEWEARHGRG